MRYLPLLFLLAACTEVVVPDFSALTVDTVAITDTLTVTDTTIVTDTLLVTDTTMVTDTVVVTDSSTVTDTVTVVDTLTLTDTLTVTDTLVRADTLTLTDTLTVTVVDTFTITVTDTVNTLLDVVALQGEWEGTRLDGVETSYTFDFGFTEVTNPRTGNPSWLFAGTFQGGEPWPAYLEGSSLYFGSLSEALLRTDTQLEIWARSVPRFTVAKQ